jgi:hypothetical protein
MGRGVTREPMSSGTLADMCDIVREGAGEKLRYFARGDGETGDIEVLYLREDLEWTTQREREVESELHEILAKESYEYLMDVDNVTQLIKVADNKILFTGFVDDDLAVASFERGILPVLPDVVGDFREYMLEHDVDFTELDM